MQGLCVPKLANICDLNLWRVSGVVQLLSVEKFLFVEWLWRALSSSARLRHGLLEVYM